MIVLVNESAWREREREERERKDEESEWERYEIDRERSETKRQRGKEKGMQGYWEVAYVLAQLGKGEDFLGALLSVWSPA